MEERLPERRLGRTGLPVTALGLGGAPLGDLFERLPESQADAVVEAAWDAGVRLYDTAPWYGHGLSEHRLGRFLRGRERSAFTLSTKVGRVYSRARDLARFSTEPWAGGLPFELRFDYRHDGILRSYEDSLQRLGLPRVDLLVIHDLDPGYHPPDALAAHRADLEKDGWRALDALRSAGEIRGIGAGINDRSLLPYFLERFDLDFLLVAMPYTLLDQGPLPELEVCRERGIAIVVGAPFASGILATGPVEGATYAYEPAGAAVLEKTRRVARLCEAHGAPLPAAALQFPLAHPAVAAVIPGATRAEFVTANARALLAPLPAALWRALRAEHLIDPAAPLPEPGWQRLESG